MTPEEIIHTKYGMSWFSDDEMYEEDAFVKYPWVISAMKEYAEIKLKEYQDKEMYKANLRLIYTKNKFEDFLNKELEDIYIKEEHKTIYQKYKEKKVIGSFIRKYYKTEFNERYDKWLKEKENGTKS